LRIIHVFDMFVSRREKWPLVCAAAAAIVSVAALGAVSVASGAAAPSQVVLAYTGVVNTLDPQQSNYGQTELIDSALYDALVTYSSPTKLVGALASSFALAPSATSVSITLRRGASMCGISGSTAVKTLDIANPSSQHISRDQCAQRRITRTRGTRWRSNIWVEYGQGLIGGEFGKRRRGVGSLER
jgi:hypothetical protein